MSALADAVTWAYGASGVAAAALYAPQLRLLARSAEARRATSLASWGGWSALGLFTLLYAVVVVGETAMTVVAGLNAACQIAVAATAAWQRLADRRSGGRPGAEAR